MAAEQVCQLDGLEGRLESELANLASHIGARLESIETLVPLLQRLRVELQHLATRVEVLENCQATSPMVDDFECWFAGKGALVVDPPLAVFDQMVGEVGGPKGSEGPGGPELSVSAAADGREGQQAQKDLVGPELAASAVDDGGDGCIVQKDQVGPELAAPAVNDGGDGSIGQKDQVGPELATPVAVDGGGGLQAQKDQVGPAVDNGAPVPQVVLHRLSEGQVEPLLMCPQLIALATPPVRADDCEPDGASSQTVEGDSGNESEARSLSHSGRPHGDASTMLASQTARADNGDVDTKEEQVAPEEAKEQSAPVDNGSCTCGSSPTSGVCKEQVAPMPQKEQLASQVQDAADVEQLTPSGLEQLAPSSDALTATQAVKDSALDSSPTLRKKNKKKRRQKELPSNKVTSREQFAPEVTGQVAPEEQTRPGTWPSLQGLEVGSKDRLDSIAATTRHGPERVSVDEEQVAPASGEIVYEVACGQVCDFLKRVLQSCGDVVADEASQVGPAADDGGVGSVFEVGADVDEVGVVGTNEEQVAPDLMKEQGAPVNKKKGKKNRHGQKDQSAGKEQVAPAVDSVRSDLAIHCAGEALGESDGQQAQKELGGPELAAPAVADGGHGCLGLKDLVGPERATPGAVEGGDGLQAQKDLVGPVLRAHDLDGGRMSCADDQGLVEAVEKIVKVPEVHTAERLVEPFKLLSGACLQSFVAHATSIEQVARDLSCDLGVEHDLNEDCHETWQRYEKVHRAYNCLADELRCLRAKTDRVDVSTTRLALEHAQSCIIEARQARLPPPPPACDAGSGKTGKNKSKRRGRG